MSASKNSLYKELLTALNTYTYIPKKDIKTIQDAFFFANEKHQGQFRKSGEEYINHPLSVALILTTIYADRDTIIAALCHDLLEDTNTTKEELKDLFGETVANLVDGVTKINNLNVSTDNDYLTNYYKKIIVGMSEDVRVIIIKLADRLHNMRTLYAIPVDRQKLNAKETIEILAPIAHHLGMHKIKSELEDLSLKYLKPNVYYDIVEKLNNSKIEREESINKMMEELSDLLNQNNIKHEIKGRAKSIYSIYKKLDTGKPFGNIFDLLAIRILVDKEQECYLALGLIHSKFKPVPKRFKDYIAMPKTNLYQTLHTTVFGLNSNLYEIQIRTYDMNEIAENGVSSHWAYKEGKDAAVAMQNMTEQKLQFYKSIIELNEEKMSNEEFVKSVKEELLSNNIYVYTPKGDVIELSRGSTPIDFAYRVHSEIGDKMTGAIVNNNIVPLSYELQNSDIIRVITNKNSAGPSREWLNIAKTTQAKNKIKSFFNKLSKEEYIVLGKDLLNNELRRKKITFNEFYGNENIKKILTDLKLNDIEELYHNIGNGKYSPKFIINHEQADNTPKEFELEKKEINTKDIKYKNDIIIGNSSNIKTHIANCCMPIPGDELIGYITKTNGISIHRKNCQNINYEDERIIEVSWNKETTNKYYSEIIIYTNSDKNLMLDIIQAASSLGIGVENVNLINKTDSNIYSVVISIKNVLDINKYINSLTKIKNVTSVERMVKGN